MNVTTEDIRKIPPGKLRVFQCEDGKKLRSANTLISTIKRTGMPKGIVDYEFRNEYDLNVILIRALRDGDVKVLMR